LIKQNCDNNHGDGGGGGAVCTGATITFVAPKSLETKLRSTSVQHSVSMSESINIPVVNRTIDAQRRRGNAKKERSRNLAICSTDTALDGSIFQRVDGATTEKRWSIHIVSIYSRDKK